MAPQIEMLRFPVEAHRATTTLEALARTAAKVGLRLQRTREYLGGSPWLMVWGPGGPDRVDPMRRQLAAGGHVIALDLAYWQRDRKFRVSIDAPHPQAWVMRRDWPADRWPRDAGRVEDTWHADGPVIVAGIGEKASVQYGAAVGAWEAEMVQAARAAGRRVWYRPKRPGGLVPHGLESIGHGPIESVLRGASCVVTWHSNVAVDAIRLGIPVVCRDGAAAAVCPSTWTPDAQPLAPALRQRFLQNLAWFQWDPREAAACWAWLREVLG